MNIYLFLSITFFIISVLTASYKTKHFYNSLLNAFFIFLYLSINIMYFSADYFTGKGITQDVLFTLEAGLDGAGFGEYIMLIAISIFLFVLVFGLSYLYLRLIKSRPHPKPKRIKGLIHNIFLLLAFLAHPFGLDLYNIYTSMHVKQSTDFDQYYKKPNLFEKQTNGYNLVYIYAESLETTYFDESIFPSLMDNLKELKKKSTEFTNINQVVATTNTIRGMTATQCAIPLFVASGGNSMGGSDSFLSGASCLGDVLKSKGYHLAFMQGSPVSFAGTGNLFTSHKFDEVYGFSELQDSLEKKSYTHAWGLYDDTLFPLVYEKFEELSEIGDPFGLFMATIDTHHPNGMTSKSCSDIPYGDGKSSSLNAAHCSDRIISEFIRKIQNSKYADKTLIVLTSDHLAMKNTASALLKKGNRKNLFLIFNPLKKQYTRISRSGSMLDVGPTILDKLGIRTDLGLGRDLYQEESLFSRLDDFNKKLLSWRKSILKLWQFPTLGISYDLNTINKEVHIGGHTYKLPMLAKIGKNRMITPFFEFSKPYNSPKKLIDHIGTFSSKQKFIWIDKCRKINQIFDLNLTGTFCVSQGSLASNIEAKSLNDDTTVMNTAQFLKNTKYNTTLYQKRMKKLQQLIHDCKKPPEGKVSIVSSCKPTLLTIPSAIRTPNKNLKLSRGLNVLTIDQSGKYLRQKFDVYRSQNAANEFLKMIEPLIEYKKFFVVIADDAIRNTYPGYKEKLEKLGLKLLSTLNLRVAYIGYQDEDGTMHESSDKDTLCQIIPSFIKPLSKAEQEAIESAKEAIESAKKERYTKAIRYSTDPNHFIAHAGGAIDGFTYMNSLEALNANYEKGFKLFELDIIETSDNVFVAAHDWNRWQRDTGYIGTLPPTLETFHKYKIKGRYTSLDMSGINKWFKKHSDTILVTDKINKPLEFSKKFVDKKQLMMELFTWDAVEEGLSVGILSAMPTGNLLKNVQKDIIEKLLGLGIKDIAISRRMIYSHKTLLKKIVDNGIHIYAFHVNKDESKDEKFVLCEENEYFYGMYADRWDFQTILDCNSED